MASIPFEVIEIIFKNLYTDSYPKLADLAVACSLVCRSWRPITQSSFFLGAIKRPLPKKVNSFPPELVEIILEYLFGLYPMVTLPGFLLNCSLVCRSWHLIAQSIMFSVVVLPSTFTRWGKIIPALKRNPTLFQYVRCVLVVNIRTAELGTIIDLLPHLRRVSIIQGLSCYRSLRESTTDALIKVGMNLTSLHLAKVLDFPIDVFYSCSALRELKCRDTTFLPPTTDGLHNPRARLKSLFINAPHFPGIEILRWFCQPQCAFDLSELATFGCMGCPKEIEGHELVKQFIHLVSPSIQDLAINPPAEYAVSNYHISSESFLYTKRLYNLRSLRLWADLKSGSETDRRNHVPWVLSFFNSLLRHDTLEEISIPCFLSIDPTRPEEIIEEIRSFQLSQLDDLFTSSKFTALKKVTIGVSVWYDAEAPNKNHILERAFGEAFPRLRERKILGIIFPEVAGYMSYEECWWKTPYQLRAT
ncbi:hypothetical protein BDN72DRAFT_959037 [Pluteus cervinus]|uniref:Uncharacterized protein n=1 Tax=Pluteus cervinus TaxID=181527 RepID=A0ACD3AXQ3_9AGAR|nr:hypothetical protein BDN72DRAFT_959037 [Pluteus cervinus]